VLVSDDASEDGTPELLSGITDPRLRVVKQDRNRGMAAARNAALSLARGAWIAFLDDDDLWAPDKLARQLDAAERSGATWVYCGVFLVTPEGAIVKLASPPPAVVDELLRTNVVRAGSSTVIAGAARLRALGGFDESFDFVNDWDLWIRLAAAGEPAAFVEEPLAAYRRHTSSYSSAGRERALIEVQRLLEKHRRLYEERDIDLEAEPLLSWLDLEKADARRARALGLMRAGKRGAALRLQVEALAESRSWRDLRRMMRLVLGDRAHRLIRGRGDDIDTTVPDWLRRYSAPGSSNSRSTDTVGSAVATSERAKNTLKP
jgi:glycosyltransferase involved in cell wall biosynthesis